MEWALHVSRAEQPSTTLVLTAAAPSRSQVRSAMAGPPIPSQRSATGHFRCGWDLCGDHPRRRAQRRNSSLLPGNSWNVAVQPHNRTRCQPNDCQPGIRRPRQLRAPLLVSRWLDRALRDHVRLHLDLNRRPFGHHCVGRHHCARPRTRDDLHCRGNRKWWPVLPVAAERCWHPRRERRNRSYPLPTRTVQGQPIAWSVSKTGKCKVKGGKPRCRKATGIRTTTLTARAPATSALLEFVQTLKRKVG
jgi:hypothetical protein